MKRTTSTLILGLFFTLISSIAAYAQYDTTITTTGAQIVWTVPTNTCITAYTFEAWGGGANGNTTTGSPVNGGGAGGYARVTATGLTPGQTFTITVGASGVNGTASTVVNPSGTTIITANGATGQTGGTGVASGTDPYTSSGGNGANGAQLNAGAWGSGGGGGAGGLGVNGVTPEVACCWANGIDGQWSAGGGGKGNGGSGGAGAYDGNYCAADANAPSKNGVVPGGGGGGGGGLGANGLVRITAFDNVRYSLPGAQTFTVPAGITAVVASVWGGGGQGGGNAGVSNGASGGGGGGFAQSVVDVTPGAVYNLYVGAGGAGANANTGNNGESSWFNITGAVPPTNATQGALATGGTGGTYAGAVGTGGVGTIGSTLRQGGNGGAHNGVAYSGGGGGGAGAGFGGNGGNGGNATGPNNCNSTFGSGGTPNGSGYARYFGGAGGNGSKYAARLPIANQPGGGGGGSGEGQQDGGEAADGMVLIEWPPIADINLTELSSGVTGYVEATTHTTFNTTNTPLHSLPVSGLNFDPCEPILITGFEFTTTGTYLASDISNFKLYYTTGNTFTAPTLVATIAAPAAAGTQTFPAFNLNVSQKIYLWVTMDISATAGCNRTITAQGSSSGDFTSTYLFSNTSSSNASGTQTFAAPTMSSASSTTICNGNSVNLALTSDIASSYSWVAASNGNVTGESTGAQTNNPINDVLTHSQTSAENVVYTITPTSTAAGCAGAAQTLTVTVNPDAYINLTSAVGTNTQTPCVNTAITDITYAITGGGAGATVAGLPAGLNGTFGAGTFTISGTPTAVGSTDYTVTTTAGTCTQKTAIGRIDVRPDAGLALSSAAGTDNQAICINTPLTSTTYTISGGATSATVTALPPGLSASFVNPTLTISGTPSTSATTSYTVTTSGTCVQASTTGTITVYALPTLTSSQTPSTICSGTSFTYTPTSGTTPTYTWARQANASINEATTTGSNGVNEVLTNTSAANTDVTYAYTLTENGCPNTQNVITTVRPNPQGSFTGNTRCAGDAASFGQLTWTATAGTGPYVVDTTASQAAVTSGVPYSLPVSTPTITSVYALTKVTDTYGCERTAGFTAGTATVTVTGAAISYTSGTPTSSTTCAGTATSFSVTATNVNSYTWEVSTDGGTVFNPIAAPGGGPVYSNYNTSQLTVSSATVAHSGYKYRSVMIPACGPNIISDTVDLTVNVLPVLSSATGAGAGGTTCSAVGAVTYTPTSVTPGTTFAWTRLGQAGIAEVTTAGTGNLNETLTNTTTSPIVVTYNYVSTALGCNDPAGEDVLATINPDANLVLTSAVGTDDQYVCKDNGITPITYTFNEGATSYTVTGLPTGVIHTPNSNTITISGTPSVDGVYNYTVQTIGSCNQTQAVGTITSGASLSSAAGTDNQVVCKNAAITPITYAVGSSSATVTPLPNGVSGAYINNVFTISGTPTVEGTFGYTVSTPGTCASPTDLTGVITVGVGPVIRGTDDQTVCEGDPITPIKFSYAGGGTPSVTGLPAGLSPTVNATNDTLTISGTPTVSGAYNYTITSTSCATQSTIFGDIAVGIGIVTPGEEDQTVCEGDLITPIKYSYAGGGSAFATGLPNGLSITTNLAKDTITISGTPTVSGAFDYTVTTSKGTCGDSSNFVGSMAIGIGIVTPGTNDQTVCEGEPITDIKYSYAGGDTIVVTGLPTGLSAAPNAAKDTLTISGTPSVSGAFDYTVTTNKGTCGDSSNFVGSIAVGIGIVTPGADDQTVCEGEAITPIRYSYAGGGNSFVSGLPNGLTALPNGTNDTISITGTPTVSGAYDYTVTTFKGTCGDSSNFVGSIAIGIGIVTPGANDQTVCEGEPITPIKYSYAGGDTAVVAGLPAGLTARPNTAKDTITIEGTPTISGAFDYTVTTNKGTCGDSSNFVGSIAIGIGIVTPGADDQTVCQGQAISPIRYSYAGGDTAVVAGLPAGLTARPNTAKDTITIEGTPTVSGAFDYTVTTNKGTCGDSSNFVGSVTIGVGVVTTGTVDQRVCKGELITPIQFSFAGGGTATVTGLPTGLTWLPVNDTVYISGAPTQEGIFNYVVQSTGGTCAGSSYSGEIVSGGGLVLGSNDAQQICLNSPITPIKYVIEGGSAIVNGLPAGVSASNVINDTLTITGSPAIVGVHTYTIITNGTCTTQQSSFTGSITAAGSYYNNGATSQLVCINDPIAAINFDFQGTLSIIGLPSGVDTTVNGNTLTISGSPSVEGSFPYAISVNSPACSSINDLYDTINVANPKASFTTDVNGATPNQPIQYTNNSVGADAYSWDFDDGEFSAEESPSHAFAEEGLFKVVLTATYKNVCPDTASKTFGIYTWDVGNVFTPNGDGKNDVYSVISKGIGDIHATVYNRWGRKVFEWFNVNDGWDGRVSATGAEAPAGTYFIVIRITDLSGIETIEKKSIELIR